MNYLVSKFLLAAIGTLNPNFIEHGSFGLVPKVYSLKTFRDIEDARQTRQHWSAG